MNGFFEELKRRKVYRVAVAYVVAAGGMIQLASAAFPAWELPTWTLRLVIVLLLIGFPIALTLAWAFDVTPQGIRTTPKADTARPIHRRRNITVLVLVGLLVSGAAGFFLLPHASARRLEKSIAVLPFESFSEDKENAFFADGIQDDILTNLAKIGDLKVISRTSVMPYRGKTGNVREIGKALGVSVILEGSVRKFENRVRVNVQLIDASNDEHIWAEEYDGDLTDVFAIQTTLAQKIAGALQAKLSPNEKAQLTRKPTENGEAYLAFVQARDLQWHMEDFAKLKQAEQLYERAMQLDPKFALAAAGYSQLESWIFHNNDPALERRDKARSLASLASQLQPDLPEGHLALGFSYYYGDSDYAAALREFEIAQRGLPNEMEVYLALGAIQRRQGRWAESNINLEKAATLNPKETWALQNLAYNYEVARDFETMNKVLERALKIEPQSLGLLGMKAKGAIEARGDFSVAEQAIERMSYLPESDDKLFLLCIARGNVRLLQRKYAEAARAAEETKDEQIAQKTGGLADKYLVLGMARRGLHDEAGARAAFSKVKELAQGRLAKFPANPDIRIQLASALAFLGEKETALAETQRALELLPLSKDAFHGPELLEQAAEIYVTVGENDRALQALTELSTRPSPVSAQLLKLNPVWDPIREDPRFQQLVTKLDVK